MKKILTIILLTATVITFTACSTSSVVSDAGDEDTEQTMFERRKLDDQYSILVDKETRVCYLIYEGDYSTEIIVLLNADGTPKIWEDSE